MAYRRGDVERRDPIDYGYDPTDQDDSGIDDSRGGPRLTAPYACLPHSCEEWVIGGITEIDMMIEDLQTVRRLLADGEDR